MKGCTWAVLSGFLVWLVPFAASVALTSVRASDRPLFETLMPVILSVTAVVFLGARRTAAGTFLRGLTLGGAWLAISIGLDLLIFMWGPMQMSFIDYMKDIGLTYLMFPVIAAGWGRQTQKARAAADASA